jgi:hypothetical protein
MIDRIEKSTDEPAPADGTPAKKSRKTNYTLNERLAANGNFTIAESATLCACSISTIYKYIREKRLAVVKRGYSTRIVGQSLVSLMRGE